jgi:DNA-binding MarR family transcriptional regulator
MTGKMGKASLASLASHAEGFRKLEEMIHVKGRLSIVSVLAATESLSFTELRNLLSLTDGNLAAHLRALADVGYVRMAKRGGDGKPLTFISLTSTGRNAFKRYLEGLEHIVKHHR